MYYSSGCNCGCNYDCGCNTVPSTCCTTSSTTTTTTIPCDGEKCDEIYSTNCITYTGPDLTCYGLQTGYSLTDILELIITHLPQCTPVDVCFTIDSTEFGLTSCLVQPAPALWEGKVYYEVKSGPECLDTLGYVYWNGDQWEFANGLGGGTELYAYLPIPSDYPVTSAAGPWVTLSSEIVIQNSLGGECPTTTTTTTAPCPCNCITFENSSSTAYPITWLDCAAQQIVVYNLEGNTRYQICGTNPFVTNPAVTFTIGGPCVEFIGKCVCSIPTTTTTSTTTTTTTAAPLCRCYNLVYEGTITDPPVIGYSYTDCFGNATGSSLVLNSNVLFCALENSISVSSLVLVFDNGPCSAGGCTTTTTVPAIIPASTTTTTSPVS